MYARSPRPFHAESKIEQADQGLDVRAPFAGEAGGPGGGYGEQSEQGRGQDSPRGARR